MMRLLHWALAPLSALDNSEFPEEWGMPPERPSITSAISFSVLYSDVGEFFYKSCGPTPRSPGWEVITPTGERIFL